MWLGRKGCSLNGMQKESANPRYSLPARISSGLLKACSMSVKMKGGWGDRQLERQVHLSPGEKSPCVLWGASSPGAAGGRGGEGWGWHTPGFIPLHSAAFQCTELTCFGA